MAKSRMSTRHGGRQHAVQVLYGLSFSPDAGANGAKAEDSEQLLRSAFAAWPGNSEDVPAENFAEPSGFAWELVQGVWNRREAIDQAIKRFSHHWRIERLGRIELSILRLTLYEMLWRREIPPKVAISEALELVSQFGEESSKPFLNGILDAAAKSLMPGDASESVINTTQD